MPRKAPKKIRPKRKAKQFRTPKKTKDLTTVPTSAPARLEAPPQPLAPPQTEDETQKIEEPDVFFTPPPTKRSARLMMGEEQLH